MIDPPRHADRGGRAKRAKFLSLTDGPRDVAARRNGKSELPKIRRRRGGQQKEFLNAGRLRMGEHMLVERMADPSSSIAFRHGQGTQQSHRPIQLQRHAPNHAPTASGPHEVTGMFRQILRRKSGLVQQLSGSVPVAAIREPKRKLLHRIIKQSFRARRQIISDGYLASTAGYAFS